MKRLLLVSVFALALSGCDFGVRTCDPGACESGSVCRDHFCVVPSDGGAKGGGTGGGATGGGGGVTGGGGGVTGGGGGNVCNPACGDGYLCEGAVCVLHVTGVVIDSPADLSVTNDGGLNLVAHLTTDATGLTFPASLAYTIESGSGISLPGSAGTYSASVMLDAGTFALRVVADFPDASFSDVATVTVDVDGPILTPLQALPTSVPRDQVLRLELSTNEALQGAVGVTLAGMAVAPGSACAGDAGCWDIDFALPQLNSMTGSFALVATATDAVGNARASPLGMINVSRLRWVTPPLGNPIRTAPAIGQDGTIYVGTSNGADTGSLVAIGWDGGVRTPVPIGAMQSVAIGFSATSGNTSGQEVVFYTANDTQGRIGARRVSDLSATGVQPPQNGLGSSPTYSGLALLSAGGNELGAIATFNSLGVASRAILYGPATGAVTGRSAPDGGGTFDMPQPGVSDSVTNVVVAGASASFVTRPSGAGLSVQTISGLPGSISEATPVTIDGDISSTSLGIARVGADNLLGGSGPMVRSLYRVNSGVIAGNLGASVDNGVPSVLSSNVAFVGRGNDLMRFDPQSLGTGGTALISSVAVRTAPLIAKARGSEPKKGYAVTSNSHVLVFDVNGTTGSGIDLGQIFGMAETVAAHPTLDCNRRPNSSSANTGILYIATTSGKVAAVIVDSPKLDDTAVWPKYQRTAGNSGNTDNTNFPINWATCP